MTVRPLRRLLLAIVLLGFAGGAVGGGIVWDSAAALVAIVVAIDLARAMQRSVLGVDVIALLAIVGAVALGEHLAAIIIALMVAGGSALDEFAEARARHELAALVGRTPHIAHRHEADHVGPMCRSRRSVRTTCC
jgi:cation transport ATPase